MKKLALFFVLLLVITFVVGCNNTEQSTAENQQANEVIKESSNFEKYKGNWKLKVEVNKELYLITSLEEYFGSTGINIIEINNGEVIGNVYSVQGAPSYRQAVADFAGKIENGKLKASYEDKGWEYTGNIELNFDNEMIAANITRDKMDSPSMWGIPEGKFTFIKPIDTDKVSMSDLEKKTLEDFLFPTTIDVIKPFAEGGLTDEMMINFVGLNLALGFLDTSEYGDKVKGNADIVFDESVMDDLTKKYFGVEVKEHKTFEITTYENGKYTVPALGGVSAYPQVQLLLKDKEQGNIYYAIVDYMFEYPEEGQKLEYQHFIKLQKESFFIIRAIKGIESPINLELLN